MADRAAIDAALAQIQQLWQAGGFDAAEALCGQLLQRVPQEPRAWFWRGLLYLQRGAFAETEAAARQAVALDPNFAWAWNHLSTAIREQGRAAEAEPAARRAVELEPSQAAHWVSLGNVLGGMARWSEATDAYQKATKLDPQSPIAWNNLGATQQKLRKLAAAEEAYAKSLALAPDFSGALINYAMVLNERGRPSQALMAAQRALTLQPASAAAWIELANAQWSLGQQADGAASYRRAIELPLGGRDDRFYVAAMLWPKWLLPEAESIAAKLVTEEPHFADGWALVGVIRQMQGRPANALVAFRRSMEIQPSPDHLSGQLLCEQYAEDVTPERLFGLHRHWHDQFAAATKLHSRRQPAAGNSDGRLRLGFVSKDFACHPVGYCSLAVLQALRRSECEVICYSDRAADDPLTPSFRAAATQWREVYELTDDELSSQIVKDEIDVLFDLAGHTGKRLLVFARRPAPVQITWFGYPGTTGLSEIDYILADRFHIPEGEERWYAERVLRMPHGYVCYSPPHEAPPVLVLPALTNGFITFGSFNNPAKLSVRTLDWWAAVLQQVPNSRLLLKYGGLNQPQTEQRIKAQFAQRGIAGERILIEGWSPHRELLAAYGRVDLALDTLPYSSGVTTCEALWMGVPVITCPGATFAGRHSVSHMTNAGYSQFVAANPASCIETAVTWSHHLEELAELRAQMRDRVHCSPLGDAPGFACDLLAVLRQAWAARGVPDIRRASTSTD